MMNKAIILYENMRTVVYVPFYLAIVRGDWAAAGIDVSVQTSSSTSETAQGLIDGRADVSWGGPMRVMLHHDRDRDCPLVCFAQVVARDPSILVGRTANERFRFDDLVGKRVGAMTDVPTPWMTLQDDLGRAGVDLGDINWVMDQSMPENAAALRAGELDVVQIFEPHADALVQAGAGHIWHRCTQRGDSCWTSFYTTQAFTKEQPETCRALVRGIERALEVLHTESPANIAKAVAAYFPDLATDALARMIEGYRASGLWARSTELPVEAFVRLKAAMISGGLISYDAPYDRLVTSFPE
ncbi:MAG: ABC transporter substrate-binding protein [Alphaproteobacteria bacterium]|nr:ABC transporter substrate-binding protein [Alphaproteobacteria bacterium]MBL6954009.1 ABC transporter substrate-binding protein [Alphaproteobacteria bacterium]